MLITPVVREQIVDCLEMLPQSFDGYSVVGIMKITEEWITDFYSYNFRSAQNRNLQIQFESMILEELWYGGMCKLTTICVALDSVSF